jgi:hypothetical protein
LCTSFSRHTVKKVVGVFAFFVRHFYQGRSAGSVSWLTCHLQLLPLQLMGTYVRLA